MPNNAYISNIKYLFIILVISLIFFVAYKYGMKDKNILGKKQQNKLLSKNEGLGYYSETIRGDCIPYNNKCGRGQRINTRKCIVNSQTNKGCIDDKGYMTFKDVKEVEECFTECISSILETFNGYEKNSPAIFTGVNRIYDPETGIDYTDDYIESYDTKTQTYILKKCIPDKLQFFYYKTYKCLSTDNGGKNTCDYVCGEDPAISLNYRLQKNIKMYYPKEDNRYVCNNIHNVNQIEFFNSGVNIDSLTDKYSLPLICYRIDEQTNHKITSMNTIRGNYSYHECGNELIKHLTPGHKSSSEGTTISKNHISYNVFKNKYAYECKIGNEKTIAKTLAIKTNTIQDFDTTYYYYDVKNIDDKFKNLNQFTGTPQSVTFERVNGSIVKVNLTETCYINIDGESMLKEVKHDTTDNSYYIDVKTLEAAIKLDKKVINVLKFDYNDFQTLKN